MSDFSYRMHAWVRSATPATVTILLIILSAVDFEIPGAGQFVPLLAVMSLFYWGTYWPALLPYWFVFSIGFFQDLLYATPIGVTSLVNLLFLWMVINLRRYLVKENFFVMWLVFSFVSLIFILLTSVIYSLYFKQFVASDMVLMQWIFSALLYPFLHILFTAIHVSFLKNHA